MAPARTHLLPAVQAQCASMVKLRVELVIVISFGKLLMDMLINSPTESGFCWTAAGFEAFFCRSHLNYPREYGDVIHRKREDYSFYLGFDNVFLWLNVAIFWTR